MCTQARTRRHTQTQTRSKNKWQEDRSCAHSAWRVAHVVGQHLAARTTSQRKAARTTSQRRNSGQGNGFRGGFKNMGHFRGRRYTSPTYGYYNTHPPTLKSVSLGTVWQGNSLLCFNELPETFDAMRTCMHVYPFDAMRACVPTNQQARAGTRTVIVLRASTRWIASQGRTRQTVWWYCTATYTHRALACAPINHVYTMF